MFSPFGIYCFKLYLQNYVNLRILSNNYNTDTKKNLHFFENFYNLYNILYISQQKKAKRKHNFGFSLRIYIISLIFRRKPLQVVQEYYKAQTRIRALLGIIIIHPSPHFVNIHFVRFFVVNFGEKYMTKNFDAFVVVIFVYFVSISVS